MQVFVTGATGYIGGTVAVRLREEGHAVTGLTRDPGKAQALADLGIRPVAGSLDDAELLTEYARGADAVVNAADSDHRAAAETLVRAMAGSGKPLVHTSGSSIVGTGTDGEASAEVFGEDVVDPASGWKPEHPYRRARLAVDRLVLAAADDGVRSVVLCPGMIYGRGRSLSRGSVLIDALVRQARAGGAVAHVGAGRNIWSTVHVDDVADAYVSALDKAPAGTFCFLESGEASFAEITGALAGSLGLPGPRVWDPGSPDNVWEPEFAAHALGGNSRVRGDRARAVLGWSPRRPPITDWLLGADFDDA